MAILSILTVPDPRLHKIATPVQVFDQRIVQLCADMLETMYAAQGVGLAATQVDVHERVLVLDVSEARNAPMVFVNPQLLWHSDDMALGQEGCLSVPEVYDKVPRYTQIRVAAQDAQGQPFELQAEDLLSVCIQHEMDHLQGKVFIEYLSPLKRGRITTRLRKAQRANARNSPANHNPAAGRFSSSTQTGDARHATDTQRVLHD